MALTDVRHFYLLELKIHIYIAKFFNCGENDAFRSKYDV